MAKKPRPISKREVCTFKIKNRRGFAAICKRNLTEGTSVAQALARMKKALKREGLLLN